MAKIDRKTFQERYNRLLTETRRALQDGTYREGDYLPAEVALAEQYQISKKSVRLALDELLKEGLIAKQPRVGTLATPPAASRTAIRFGVYPSLYQESEIGQLIQLFEQENPDVRVEPLELPYSRTDTIRQFIRLGIVDVMTLNHFDYKAFRESGSLDLLEPSAKLPETYPFLNELFAAPEGIAIRPLVFSPVILCYNKRHFEQRGLFEPDSSWTWADLLESLRQLKEPGRYGMFFHLASHNRWPLFFLQSGGRFEKGPDGVIRMPCADGWETLRTVKRMLEEDGLFPPLASFDEEDMEELFRQEKVSVVLTTYYRLKEFTQADFPFDIAQLPLSRSGETLLLASGIAVAASSRQKEAASRFAAFVTSEEAQSLIRRSTFSLLASRKVTEKGQPNLTNKPARLELHREMVPRLATYEGLGLTTYEMEVFAQCLKQYFSGLIGEDGLMELFNKQLQGSQETARTNEQ